MRGLNQYVVVVIHEHPGMQEDLVLINHSCEYLDKQHPIGIISNDRLAFIPSRRHMVDGMRKLNA